MLSSSATPMPSHPPSLQPRHHSKRTPVPLLLEAFPSPPTHIPPSPFPTPLPYNPPPSLPPADPLPPVPGPSPITEHETLLFLASRRSSKISLAPSLRSNHSSPSLSRRDSLISSVVSTTAVLSPAQPLTRGGSIASARSTSSLTPTYPTRHDSSTIAYSISEEDPADLTRIGMGALTRISPVPPSDVEEAEENVLSEMPAISRRRPLVDESISSINMNDLPADDDALDIDFNTHAQTLHLRMRASRSRSAKHKALLLSRNTSPTSNPSSPPTQAPLPLSSTKIQQENTRSDSPDITAILAATPRPRRTSSHQSNPSSRSGSRSRSRPRAQSAALRRSSKPSIAIARRTSGGSCLHSDPPTELGDAPETWEEDSFVSDYGVPLEQNHAELEEIDGSDSDSSIDLHTPLPHLMLRHGMLSPNSKLLPQSSRAPSPLPSGRPGSMLSVASSNTSIMAKSGIFRDERDTPKRRVRHRDGRLLRGGIGLTTGLGWSDSEDEDAPSALTHRLSSLNLSRRSSSSSLHPLSRSYSGEKSPEKFGVQLAKPRSKPRASLPPTAWPKRSTSGRTSTSSAGSTFSLTLSIPEHESMPPYFTTPNYGQGAKDASDVRTPSSSTASTMSISLPVTPEATEDAPSLRKVDREKVLPPLPGKTLRKYPSNLSLRSAAGSAVPTPSLPRSRTYSSSTSSASSSGAPPVPSTSSRSDTRLSATPRALHLTKSQSQVPRLQPGEKPGQGLTYNRNLHDQQRLRTASGPASRPSGISRPPSQAPTSPLKPRTGTGMVYRTSSNPGMGGSRIRALNTASIASTTSSHSPPLSRPIAL